MRDRIATTAGSRVLTSPLDPSAFRAGPRSGRFLVRERARAVIVGVN
jgi:hypothetical protein